MGIWKYGSPQYLKSMLGLSYLRIDILDSSSQGVHMENIVNFLHELLSLNNGWQETVGRIFRCLCKFLADFVNGLSVRKVMSFQHNDRRAVAAAISRKYTPPQMLRTSLPNSMFPQVPEVRRRS